MTLEAEQKNRVNGWIGEGRSLSEIQDLLKSELDIGLTYMEVRFLVDDLGLQLQDPEPDPEPESEPEAPAAGATQAAESSADDAAGKAPPVTDPDNLVDGGKVSVVVDKIARPGAIVSGRVTFSDGKRPRGR